MIGDCQGAVDDYRTVLARDSTKKDAQKRLPEAQACVGALNSAEAHKKANRWDIVRDSLTEALKVCGCLCLCLRLRLSLFFCLSVDLVCLYVFVSLSLSLSCSLALLLFSFLFPCLCAVGVAH